MWVEGRNLHKFITALKRSLRRLCFHRCLSVHGGRGWECIKACTGQGGVCQGGVCPGGAVGPEADTPPEERQISSPWILRDTVNKRTVRIPLESILVGVGRHPSFRTIGGAGGGTSVLILGVQSPTSDGTSISPLSQTFG